MHLQRQLHGNSGCAGRDGRHSKEGKGGKGNGNGCNDVNDDAVRAMPRTFASTVAYGETASCARAMCFLSRMWNLVFSL